MPGQVSEGRTRSRPAAVASAMTANSHAHGPGTAPSVAAAARPLSFSLRTTVTHLSEAVPGSTSAS